MPNSSRLEEVGTMASALRIGKFKIRNASDWSLARGGGRERYTPVCVPDANNAQGPGSRVLRFARFATHQSRTTDDGRSETGCRPWTVDCRKELPPKKTEDGLKETRLLPQQAVARYFPDKTRRLEKLHTSSRGAADGRRAQK